MMSKKLEAFGSEKEIDSALSGLEEQEGETGEGKIDSLAELANSGFGQEEMRDLRNDPEIEKAVDGLKEQEGNTGEGEIDSLAELANSGFGQEEIRDVRDNT